MIIINFFLKSRLYSLNNPHNLLIYQKAFIILKDMQIFELHFNPKNKEGKLIDTFCYQPADVYEKRLGALAIAGELTEGSSNRTLLNNLASKIKGAYHSLPTRSQEEALREGLQTGNQFLSKNSWSGDLNLATLSIKENLLQFSKIGEIKILLSRNKELTDIGKNASDEDYSFGSIVTGKIKKNDKLIVLTEDIYSEFLDKDLLIELAQSETVDNFLLEKISKIQKEKFPKTSGICLLIDFSIETATQEKIINKDQFSFKKTFIKISQEVGAVASLFFQKLISGIKSGATLLRKKGKPTIKQGAALLLAISRDLKKLLKFIFKKIKEKSQGLLSKSSTKIKSGAQRVGKEALKKKEHASQNLKQQKEKLTGSKDENPDSVESEVETESSQPQKEKSYYSGLDKIISLWSRTVKRMKSLLNEIFSKLKSPLSKLEIKNKISSLSIPEEEEKRRSFYLAGLLILIILIGSITTHMERSRRMEEQREDLALIQSEIEDIDLNSSQAYTELINHHAALNDFIRQTTYDVQAEKLRNLAVQKLLKISNTEIVERPELVFSPEEVVPSKIEYINGEIYSYNPFLPNAEKYNPETGEHLVRPINPADGGIFSTAALGDNEVLFFSRPDELIFSNDEQISANIEVPYADFSFQNLKTYQNQIYLLERNNNQIVRYNRNNLSEPEQWIQERSPGDILSFAIDGSIWTLKEKNKVWRYEENRPSPQGELEVSNIFPIPERFTDIETSQENPLYILEPTNSRVIVISKEGELLGQFIFPGLENIKDFTIGQNKIYLLDDQEVYQLEVDF